jgi:hypothetical protein
MENQFLFSKHFFLENKTRKSKVVKLHLISGEPVSILQEIIGSITVYFYDDDD